MYYPSKCTKWRKLRDFEMERILFQINGEERRGKRSSPFQMKWRLSI
jgi:hypothetical protein